MLLIDRLLVDLLWKIQIRESIDIERPIRINAFLCQEVEDLSIVKGHVPSL